MRTLQTEGNAAAKQYAPNILALGPWFHNLHLPDGTQTAPDHPLGDFPRFKWEQIAPHLAPSLEGRTVLDVGCNAGFYSLALAARGAEVLGIDSDARYLNQARWAAGLFPFGSRLHFEQRDVYSLATVDTSFDIVLFMGVFYHLRYPVLGLDIVASRCRDILVFQSLSAPGAAAIPLPQDLRLNEREQMRADSWPKMAFIPHAFEGDATNWWAPNASCIEFLLADTGFDITARPGHEIYIARRNGTERSPAWHTEFQSVTRTGRTS